MEQNGQPQPVRRSVNEIQGETLFRFFQDSKAEEWTEKETNLKLRQLLLDPLYQNLERYHLKYQLDKYRLEFRMRKQVGEQFCHITLGFCHNTDKLMRTGMWSIMSDLYLSLTRNSEVNLNIPLEFVQFLTRCHEHFLHGLIESNIPHINPHAENDTKDCVMFANFVKKSLLPQYAECWKQFSVMDINNDNQHRVYGMKTESILSTIELEVCTARYGFIDENSVIYQNFTTKTNVKTMICNVDNCTILYPPGKLGTNLIYYPEYTQSVVLDNDKLPLLKLILGNFEDIVWNYYLANLTIQNVYIFRKLNTYTTSDTTDNNMNTNTATENEDVFVNMSIQQVLYYVCGSSVEHMIDAVSEYSKELNVLIRTTLRNKLTLSLDVAREHGLPCEKQAKKERNNGKLVYASDCVYSLVLKIESHILAPLLCDLRLIAMYGECFLIYITNCIKNEGYKHEFNVLVIDALRDIRDNFEDVVYESLVKSLVEKFYDYFISVVAKHYVNYVMSVQKLKDKPIRAVSFRKRVLTDTICKK